MPRNWLTSILFALALAVQALMPVASGVASARGVDLNASSATCLNGGEAGHKQDGPGHVHRGGHHDCVLCQAFCDGVAPVAARPSALSGVAFVQWTEIRWADSDRVLPARWRDFSRQARGPPSFS